MKSRLMLASVTTVLFLGVLLQAQAYKNWVWQPRQCIIQDPERDFALTDNNGGRALAFGLKQGAIYWGSLAFTDDLECDLYVMDLYDGSQPLGEYQPRPDVYGYNAVIAGDYSGHTTEDKKHALWYNEDADDVAYANVLLGENRHEWPNTQDLGNWTNEHVAIAASYADDNYRVYACFYDDPSDEWQEAGVYTVASYSNGDEWADPVLVLETDDADGFSLSAHEGTDIVYLALHERNGTPPNAVDTVKLFRSTDSGASWSALPIRAWPDATRPCIAQASGCIVVCWIGTSDRKVYCDLGENGDTILFMTGGGGVLRAIGGAESVAANRSVSMGH